MLKTITDYKPARPDFPHWVLPFVLGLLAILMQTLMPEFAQQGLDLIDSFFIYALLAQFSHLGWMHLALNLAGLAIVVWGFEAISGPRTMAFASVWGLAWVAAYVSWVEPLAWYCGLSGALHALFTTCLVLAWRAQGLKWNWALCLLTIGLLAKLAIEWGSASTAADPLIGGPIAQAAHRGGAMGGFLLGLLFVAVQGKQSQHQHQTE